ncbi:hypothetical protein HZ994_11490 [Akkermansiaceae bacterium]|nr:hypothetical protein HZ994_11490 [Akkermansiaceae bacterium]
MKFTPNHLLPVAAAFPFIAAGPASAGNVGVGDLKAEQLANPVQLDIVKPRLSWQLKPTRPDERMRHRVGSGPYHFSIPNP